MAREIERKFLLRDERWRAAVTRSRSLRQAYLNLEGPVSVRVRLDGVRANLNIKSATRGVTRTEFEYPIPRADAEELLEHLRVGAVIDKTRHEVDHRGHTWEIDEFAGENAGLIVAEIELDAADADFARPPWLGEEVSDDIRYYNVELALRPYRSWGAT